MTVKEVLETIAKLIEKNDIQNDILQEYLYVLALKNRKYPECFQTLLPIACECVIYGHELSFNCINEDGSHNWTYHNGSKVIFKTLHPLQYDFLHNKDAVYRSGYFIDNTLSGYITLDPHKPETELGFEPIMG